MTESEIKVHQLSSALHFQKSIRFVLIDVFIFYHRQVAVGQYCIRPLKTQNKTKRNEMK